MPERSESKTVTLASDTTHTITFETPFKEIPRVFVTPHNFTSNDAYAISAITRTGFSLYIDHHGHPSTPHTISWLAVGFGREAV
jgi:hypothetical protein